MIVFQVCGTDYKTYDNEAQMNMIACETAQDIKKAYTGPCQGESTASAIVSKVRMGVGER